MSTYRNFRKYLFIFILVIIGGLSFCLPVFGAEVSITPSSTEVTVGSQFTVTVQISAVTNLFGVAFDLLFDPNVLKFVAPAVEGGFLKQDGASTFFLAAESLPGDVAVGDSRLAEVGITGSGDLMNLTFEALTAGTSSLTFQFDPEFSLTDPGSAPIPADWQNATVAVTSGQSFDTVSPSVPANLQVAATSSSQINLSWTASTDNVGVAGYKIYRDGIEIATTTDAFHSDTGLTASTTYTYTVSAYDEASNESAQSESVGTTTLNKTPLTIVSITPSSTEVTVGSQFTVTVQISAVTNLFGVAFDLLFDPAVLSFVSEQKGTFLEQGAGTTLLTAVNPAGDLIVGYSRLVPNGGVSGDGDLLIFTFKSLTSGTSTLVFQTRPESLVTPNLNLIPATWDGGFVTVSPAPLDATPPVRSSGSPIGTLTTGTTQTNLSLITDENAACRYSTTAGTLYASTTDTFSTTGGTSHSTTVAGLQNGQTYNYYARCIDSAGNVNIDDFVISFSIATASVSSPAPSGGGGGGIILTPLSIASESVKETVAEGGRVTIAWLASDYSTGQVIYSSENESHTLDLNDTIGSPPKYGYARTTNEFDINPKTTFHSVSLTDVQPGTIYYYRTVSRGSFAVSPEYRFTFPEIKEKTKEIGVVPSAEGKPVKETISPSAREQPVVFEEQIPKQMTQEVKKIDLVQEVSIEKIPAKGGLLAAIATSINTKYDIMIGAIIIAILAAGWWIQLIIRKKKKQ